MHLWTFVFTFLPLEQCKQEFLALVEESAMNDRYRVYSINCPGRLLNFWTLRVGAYSRWVLIRGWAVIKFSPFSARVVVYFATKQ